MSIEINLLPWREAKRDRLSRRFLGGLALSALLGGGGGWAATLWYQQALEAQQQRNQYIEVQTQQLDQDIQAIREYQALREQMLTQIELIRELQFSRPQTVRVVNQLVETLEDGVYYTQLSRQDAKLRFSGLAESNRQVSEQMRALAAAEVFATPTLSEVQVAADGQRRRFDMSAREVLPEAGGSAVSSEENTP